jgi:hypothetical protein
MLPLTVSRVNGSCQSARPIAARIDPLTVLALPQAAVEKVAAPLTVVSDTGPLSPVAVTSPSTVRPTKCTPGGTRTWKVTRTCSRRTWWSASSPGRHSSAGAAPAAG